MPEDPTLAAAIGLTAVPTDARPVNAVARWQPDGEQRRLVEAAAAAGMKPEFIGSLVKDPDGRHLGLDRLREHFHEELNGAKDAIVSRVLRTAVLKAEAGDNKMIKLILENLGGITPVKRTEITGKDGEAIQVQHTARLAASEVRLALAGMLSSKREGPVIEGEVVPDAK